VRRNALAVVPHDARGLAMLLDNKQVFADSDVQVRLQALLTLADIPESNDVGELVATAAARPGIDNWEGDAVTCAAATHPVAFLKAITFVEAEGREPSGDAVSATALKSAEIIAEHIARSRPDLDRLQGVLAAISNAPPEVIEVTVRGLMAGWPRDFALQATGELDATLLNLLKNTPASGKGRLLQLAARCGSQALESQAQEIVTALMAVVTNEDAAGSERVAAADELLSFKSDDVETLSAVLDIIKPQTSPELAIGLIEACRQCTAENAGSVLIERSASFTPQLKAAVVRVLLSRPATTVTLLTAFKSGAMDLADLTLDQKQALRAHPDRMIRVTAERLMEVGGGLPDADREKVLQSLLPICEEDGDAKLGREMFVKHCSKCHLHGTEGKNIGPNLTGMAVHPKHELLMHIIDPSRSVEGNFRIYTVATIDGVVINGMMSGESRTAITLVDSEAKEHQIAREDIEELVRSRKSLMPEGFEKQMTPGDISNLLQFLTDKGKYVPVSLDRYATAISTKGLFGDGDNGPDRMVFSDWTPKIFKDVPFVLTDPRGKSVPNIILLNGPRGTMPPTMPRSVTLPCNSEAKAIHLLSGVGGWSFPFEQDKSVSMIVRLKYKGGETEDIELRNGVHFADYIRRVDVPESEFAFALGSQQIRRITVTPKSQNVIESIDLVKGRDATAPIVMAVTVERP
jgi:hypothetical protein